MKQGVGPTAAPAPPRRSAVDPYDYERLYERNGVSNLFMLFARWNRWRRVGVTDRRTKVDWAHQVKKSCVDAFGQYPDAGLRIVLVMDNQRWACAGAGSNTHDPASIIRGVQEPMEAPAYPRTSGDSLHPQAWELAGSWLKSEIGVLARQCLDRRIPDQEVLTPGS